ncbi:MAG TPA: efflux RND transporter periplasmic adaptor subunit [Gemmatimonadaceae bacterium]|nr:efflux RND transporter periplasmic adaptor subunit [Gemmatimonadaceae bacterium]
MSATPARKHRPGDESRELRLPGLDEASLPGSRLVRRAASLTLATFAAGLLVLVALVFSVRTQTTVDASGVVEPATVWPVRARASGLVGRLLVRSGDTVRSGQVLGTLDSAQAAMQIAQVSSQLGAQVADSARQGASAVLDRRSAAAQIQQATAHLIRARAALRQRLVDFGLQDKMDSVIAHSGAGTNVMVDAAVADVLAAQGELAAAQTAFDRTGVSVLDAGREHAVMIGLRSQLRASRLQRDRLLLTAPAAGVVLTGQLETVIGSLVHEGDIVLELGDPSGWRATLSLAEQDVDRIRIGDRASLEIPALYALDGDRVRGRVISIANESGSDARAADQAASASANRYRVIVSLDQRQLDSLGLRTLRRGYAVRAKIITRSERLLTRILDQFRRGARSLR